MNLARVTEFGISLPADVLAQLGVHPGDELQVIATGDQINLRRVEPAVEAQFEVAKQVMERRHDVLRRLAE